MRICVFHVLIMVFSKEDKIDFDQKLAGIQRLQCKKFSKEFPDKTWNRKGLDYLLKKLRTEAEAD